MNYFATLTASTTSTADGNAFYRWLRGRRRAAAGATGWLGKGRSEDGMNDA
jgi:hypothetical protein